uniref:LO8 n=1 Tax=Grenadier adomavirus TaxID=2609868 RepID=A0A6F9FAB5_9VIRU|nr:TPA_asm: LO8 [Grenadier adomavirus]
MLRRPGTKVRMIPMAGAYRRSRREPYTTTRQRRAGISGSLLHHELLQPPDITPEGNFLNWGWLSIPEMKEGLRKLKLHNRVLVRVTTTPFCNLPHIPHDSAVIFLIRKHYVVVVHVCRKLLFFDPLRQPVSAYFGNELPQLAPLHVLVQPAHSALCGNFCLFVLHLIFKGIVHSDYNKSTIVEGVRDNIEMFLYVDPQPTDFNIPLIEYFTIDHRLGEEFDTSKYMRFHRYDSHLSSKCMS